MMTTKANKNPFITINYLIELFNRKLKVKIISIY